MKGQRQKDRCGTKGKDKYQPEKGEGHIFSASDFLPNESESLTATDKGQCLRKTSNARYSA